MDKKKAIRKIEREIDLAKQCIDNMKGSQHPEIVMGVKQWKEQLSFWQKIFDLISASPPYETGEMLAKFEKRLDFFDLCPLSGAERKILTHFIEMLNKES